ncbi:hypothetical protein [Nocardioides sp. URHA0032]|uniref:hypothetical protein n=1 Tax=Nocardioides sp. URHA0032 TaxID=1380388 RepID=UPI00048FD764|nr:hypothetical protein [Nocardioides sp. URHA0032]
MNDLELQLHDQLPRGKRRRLVQLAKHRLYLARIIAELACWGVVEVPALERQLELVEASIVGLAVDPALARQLVAFWVAYDASLVHDPGTPPLHLDCATCAHGALGLGDILARLPD